MTREVVGSWIEYDNMVSLLPLLLVSFSEQVVVVWEATCQVQATGIQLLVYTTRLQE